MAGNDFNQFFPDINEIARARAQFSRTRRAEELQPGLLKKQQNAIQAGENTNTLAGFDIASGQRKQTTEADTASARKLIAAGDPRGFQQMAVANPGEMNKIADAQAAQRKVKRDEYDRGAVAIGRAAMTAMKLKSSGASDAEIQQDWTTMRKSIISRNASVTEDDIPEKPSAHFVTRAVAWGSSIATLQTDTGVGVKNELVDVGAPGVAGGLQKVAVNPQDPGNTIPVGPVKTPKPPTVAKGSTDVGGVKSAVSSLLLRGAQQLLGGLFDSEGNLISMDSGTQEQAQNLAARAEQIHQNQRIPPMQALKQAAEEAGIDFDQLGTTVRDQRSPTGKSVSKPGGQRGTRGSRGQTPEQQREAFRDFVGAG